MPMRGWGISDQCKAGSSSSASKWLQTRKKMRVTRRPVACDEVTPLQVQGHRLPACMHGETLLPDGAEQPGYVCVSLNLQLSALSHT